MKLKSIIALLLIALCVSLTTLTVSAADVPSVAVGDLNGDGFINTTDVVLLRRYIAGGYDVELVPPTPVGCDHNIVTDPAVAPTCTVTGLTEGKHCSKCGEVFVKQEVVPVTKHNSVDGVCTICGVVTQTPLLNEAATIFVEDLTQFRDRLDPKNDDADLYNATTRGTLIAYINGEGYKFDHYYSNTFKFEELVAIIDKAIADIQAISADSFKDMEVQIKTPDATTFGSNNKKKHLYWVNEEAKTWFYAEELTFLWLISNETGSSTADKGRTITNSSNSGDYITLNNTGIPVTYTRTAEQQAILMAQTLYANAFNDVYQALIALGETNHLNKATNNITNTTEYKTIKTNVKGNAELLAEVEAYAKIYTDKMTSIAGDKKYSFSGNAFRVAVSTNDYINQQDAGKAFVFNNSTLVNAENFILDGLTDDLQSYVDKFDATFYTDASKKESNIILLYYYRQEAIDYITDVIESYKNRYETVSTNHNGILTTETVQIRGSYYVYDRNATKASVNGKAFEAQLDALLESYVAKINAVTLNSRIDVKNYFDKTINTKPGDFSWTLTSAKQTVNAYVVDLLGEAEARQFSDGVKHLYTDTSYFAEDGIVYNTGDSRVLAAYRTYYEQNYTAYNPIA